MTTLTELLDQQEQNLDQMLTLLAQEFDLLKQRQALSLAELATSKQQQLETIVALDNAIAAHPDVSCLSSELLPAKMPCAPRWHCVRSVMKLTAT